MLSIRRSILQATLRHTFNHPSRLAVINTLQRRGFARVNDRDFREKEQSQEKEWINAREREALRRLLAEIEARVDPNNANAKKELDSILAEHHVDQCKGLNEALLQWRTGELDAKDTEAFIPVTREHISEGDAEIVQSVVKRIIKKAIEKEPIHVSHTP